MKQSTISIVGLILVSILLVGAVIFQNSSKLKAVSNAFVALSSASSQSDQTIFDLAVLSHLTTVVDSVAQAKLTPLFLQKDQRQLLATVQEFIPEIQTVLHELSQGEQRWILLFQNSNELRATGGFMGSYALIELNQGKVTQIDIEDIYDADGQFNGYFDAPNGVSQYLSSGKGLRLPDANWHVDTKKSAEQILPFFAMGNKQNVKGIIFVNLEFAKKLLTFLGPIELTDYNTIVTEDNIDEVLRSRRDDFFPGSMQKKHMLSLLLTQVRIQILKLEPKQLIALLAMVADEIQKHNLQFYSNNPAIDTVFSLHNMRQTVSIPENSEYLYLVESNVGINKANKGISREVTINKKDDERIISVSFTNSNKKPTTSKLTSLTELDPPLNATTTATQIKINNHLAYINYQRIIVPKNWTLNSIEYKNQKITNIDQETIIQNETEFNQIGFLVVLQEEEQANLSATFTTTENFDQIYIQKQPGLPATNYILEYNQEQSVTELEKNILLTYP